MKKSFQRSVSKWKILDAESSPARRRLIEH